MKKHAPLRLKELLLLSLPVLGLVLYGVYALGQRKPELTKLVITENQLSLGGPITPLKKGKPQKPIKRFFKMVTFFGYEGEKPSWWGEKVYIDTRINFVTANAYFNDSDIYSASTYDPKTERYSFTFQTQLPIKPTFLENATCNTLIVAMTQTSPRTVLGRVYVSKPLKELLQTSKPVADNKMKSPFPILPRRYERPESAPF